MHTHFCWCKCLNFGIDHMDVLLNDFEGKCMGRDMYTVCFCFLEIVLKMSKMLMNILSSFVFNCMWSQIHCEAIIFKSYHVWEHF